MDNFELVEPFARMLEAIAPPAAVRAIEHGGSADDMWAELEASGFLDALVAEEKGGAGLSLALVNALWQELGRRAVPLPVGETMIARALLAAANRSAPEGPIVLVVTAPGQRVVVPLGSVARHALVESAGALSLLPVAPSAHEATGVVAELSAVMNWDVVAGPDAFSVPKGGLRPLLAILRASLIAGAGDRLLEMTAAYANERIQFGKPIGRQQALQQNMAMMAEDAVAARIASQIGCSMTMPPALAAAAIAKSVTSSAAARIAAIAHSVHGAIGISEEHDLQLLTRRLHQWRLADGSEKYWNRELGVLRLHHVEACRSDEGSVDFVRRVLERPCGPGTKS